VATQTLIKLFYFKKLILLVRAATWGELEWSLFLTSSSLELRELAYKLREDRLVVLVIEPCPITSLKRGFEREVEEANTRVSLNSHSPVTFQMAAID
jgi:hypothetical protein